MVASKLALLRDQAIVWNRDSARIYSAWLRDAKPDQAATTALAKQSELLRSGLDELAADSRAHVLGGLGDLTRANEQRRVREALLFACALLAAIAVSVVVLRGLRKTLFDVGSTLSNSVDLIAGVATEVQRGSSGLATNSNRQAVGMVKAREGLENVRSGADVNASLAGQAQERLERLMKRLDQAMCPSL